MDMTPLYVQHAAALGNLCDSLTKTIAALRKEMDLSRRELHHLAELLADDGRVAFGALLLRFYKKHKFNLQNAEAAILDHIDWRLQNDLPNISLATISPSAHQFFQKGLFYFHRTDRLGRPVAVLNLKHYKSGDMEDMRTHFILAMEVARRVVYSINDEYANRRQLEVPEAREKLIVQLSIIIDLAGVSLKSLNYEIIPLFHDLFNRHFPQTIGTVYVLNYGWFHAGVWQLLKTALPADATKKLMFLTKEQLCEHVAPENLLQEHGGIDTTTYSLPNSYVYQKYACHGYHNSSRRVHERIAALDAEDEGYHEDDDIWYDALEHHPMTPVRSAVDLQNMLRVSSNRNLHGMNRVTSHKSLKDLTNSYTNRLVVPQPPKLTTIRQQSGTSVPRVKGRRRALMRRAVSKAVQSPVTLMDRFAGALSRSTRYNDDTLVPSRKWRFRYIAAAVFAFWLVWGGVRRLSSSGTYWSLVATHMKRKLDISAIESPMAVAAAAQMMSTGSDTPVI
ncbi:hypothetical protein HDU85_002605 [Gaertneriomyces sp. JEL0708]|nr:hypothetical protein HDU85_002605 [Gaertneriomyces sp. JEL0708]